MLLFAAFWTFLNINKLEIWDSVRFKDNEKAVSMIEKIKKWLYQKQRDRFYTKENRMLYNKYMRKGGKI